MVYSNLRSSQKISNYRRVVTKIGKVLIQYFPFNKIRILGLKMCGFQVGKHVYAGPDMIIASILGDTSCNLEIGDRVAIGPRVTIVLSSDANWSNLNSYIEPIKGRVVIKNDVWIGAGAIILPNITINEMAVIGAGAVVTKDVDPYTVVAGIPAVQIRKIR